MSNKLLPSAALLVFAVAFALADDKPKADQTAKNLVVTGIVKVMLL